MIATTRGSFIGKDARQTRGNGGKGQIHSCASKKKKKKPYRREIWVRSATGVFYKTTEFRNFTKAAT